MRKFKVNKSITNRDNEIFNIYLKEVSHYPLLTAEEEKDLANKVKLGDKRAKDKLINSNLRFVISVAKQYQGQDVDLMDLIEVGNIGLIKAASKFDPDRGYKFISYAVWWIRQAIIQHLALYSRLVRLPVSQSSNIIKINKEISKFESLNGRIPSNEELGEILDIDPDKIDRILSSNKKCISVETPFKNDDTNCLLDIIPNENAVKSDSITNDEDDKTNLKLLLDKLTIREHDILILSYGLLSTQYLSYDEIGKRFGVTGERIRQIHLNVLDKIKTNFLDLAKELL